MAKLESFYSHIFTSIQSLISGDQSGNVEVIKGALLICQAAMQSIKTRSFLEKVF